MSQNERGKEMAYVDTDGVPRILAVCSLAFCSVQYNNID